MYLDIRLSPEGDISGVSDRDRLQARATGLANYSDGQDSYVSTQMRFIRYKPAEGGRLRGEGGVGGLQENPLEYL